MESARRSSKSAGTFLVICSIAYGFLSVVGGAILALQEESGCGYYESCEKPFLVFGIAAAFVGVFIAAITFAIGQYIVFRSSTDTASTLPPVPKPRTSQEDAI